MLPFKFFIFFVPGTCDTCDTVPKGISFSCVFVEQCSVEDVLVDLCYGFDHSFVCFINHLEGSIQLQVYKIDLTCTYTKWPFYHTNL